MYKLFAFARYLGVLTTVILLSLAESWVQAAEAADPLNSPRWEDMRREFFSGAEVIFDPQVVVHAPRVAEDPMQVPVFIEAGGLGEVSEIMVFADFNPIVRVLRYFPEKARPVIGFRMKLQQSSPVRAAVRTRDGVWHVWGSWIETSGGGCTAPSLGRAQAGWRERLGRVQGRLWMRDGGPRLRVRVEHPMDTGLAPGIPAFYLEELSLADQHGVTLLRLESFEPLAENPVFTFDLDRAQSGDGPFALHGRDNNGNRVFAWIGH